MPKTKFREKVEYFKILKLFYQIIYLMNIEKVDMSGVFQI